MSDRKNPYNLLDRQGIDRLAWVINNTTCGPVKQPGETDNEFIQRVASEYKMSYEAAREVISKSKF